MGSDIASPTDPSPSLVSPPPSVSYSNPEPSGNPRSVSDSTATTSRSPVQKAEDALGHADRLGRRAVDNVEHAASGTWEAASSTADSWAGTVSKLSVFAGVVGGVGEVHPWLKAATSAINGISKPIVAQVARDDAFEELLEEMRLAYDHVIREPGMIALPKKKAVNRQTALLKDICRESEQCALFIQNEYIRKFWARTTRNALYGDDVDEKIEQYKSVFTRLRARWQEELLHYLKGDTMLDKLSPERHGGHSSQRACLPGTRTDVLREIRQWIEDPDSPRVLFLLGVAGSGKSTIAHTVAENAYAREELGSFFAFNRNDATRVPERLLGTIAHHLAHWDEEYRDWLGGVLKSNILLADSPDIMKQWKRLIVEPAAAISSSGPVVVIIDAFDECPEIPDGSRRRLLDCLTVHAAELPNSFRVLVTSRPLDRDSHSMTAPSVRRLDLSDFPATRDIQRYVRSQLPPPSQGGLSNWQCDDIAQAAGGLFQWAATACRFLDSRLAGTTMSDKFKANLELLEHGNPGPAALGHGPPSLDALYAAVLDTTFEVSDRATMSNFRSALAVMLCAEIPLSVDTLQSIYGQARPSGLSVVRSVLGSMGSVLEGASSTNSPVRPMHLSLREFLLNSSRSGPWHISEADIVGGHRILALGGLRVMAGELRFNMHDFPSSLSEISSDWHRAISDRHPALTYSISYLPRHLQAMQSGTIGADFRVAFRALLYDKLLFWFEWLSLRGEFTVGKETLDFAQHMLTGDDSDVLFAKDAATFLETFRDMIHLSAPHIYLSALPFAPANSPVRRHYIRQYPRIPTISPLYPSWAGYKPAHTAELPRVAWSMDGLYIREDREHHPSRCWDSRTGTAVDLPPGKEWRYPSRRTADGGVAVSFLGSLRPFSFEVDVVHNPPRTPAVSFVVHDGRGYSDADVSPDGRWLALVSQRYGEVRRWDLATGEAVGKIVYRTVVRGRGSRSVTFSPDSREVVVSDADYPLLRVFIIDTSTDYPRETNGADAEPQPTFDPRGKSVVNLLCSEQPYIQIPTAYEHLMWQPGMRLLLGAEPLTIDFTNAFHGPEWTRCYAENAPAVAS